MPGIHLYSDTFCESNGLVAAVRRGECGHAIDPSMLDPRRWNTQRASISRILGQRSAHEKPTGVSNTWTTKPRAFVFS